MSNPSALTSGPFIHQDGNTYFTKMGETLTADLILDKEHNWIAAVFQDQVGPKKQWENAKVMAASWDMLKALEASREVIHDFAKLLGQDPAPYVEYLDKTIAKAKEKYPEDPELDAILKEIIPE